MGKCDIWPLGAEERWPRRAGVQHYGPMQDAATPQRSTFVSVVAWIFIVLAGFSTFMSAAQNVMFSMAGFGDIPPLTGAEAEQMPPFFRFMLQNMRLVMLSFLLVSAATLVSAIGLLRRRNWARLVFIAIMAMGIAWNIAGLAVQYTMFGVMNEGPPGMSPDFRAEFDRMASTMLVMMTVITLAFSALFAWIIKRLMSRAVREEFGAV